MDIFCHFNLCHCKKNASPANTKTMSQFVNILTKAKLTSLVKVKVEIGINDYERQLLQVYEASCQITTPPPPTS